MRRPLPAIVLSALISAACTSEGEPDPSPAATLPSVTSSSATPTTSSPSPVSSPSPTPQPDVQLPPGAPFTVDDAARGPGIETLDPAPFAPPGASVESSVLYVPRDPIDQITVRWVEGDPPDRRAGLIVWQRFDERPPWRAVYAFTDGPRSGVFGIRLQEGDLTADGIPDLLSFEDVGGSGACGTTRVIASRSSDAEEIFRRDVCDTEIVIAGGDLEVREAVYGPDDPHCCPSAYRTTTLRWNGTRWEKVASDLQPTSSTGT